MESVYDTVAGRHTARNVYRVGAKKSYSPPTLDRSRNWLFPRGFSRPARIVVRFGSPFQVFGPEPPERLEWVPPVEENSDY